MVKVLCYKSEGRWFDPSWFQWIFHWHKIVPIALYQKWVPGIFPGGKGGPCVRLTTYHHPVPLWRNLGNLTSWNPLGLFRPVTGLLYLYHINFLDNYVSNEMCFFFVHSTATYVRPRKTQLTNAPGCVHCTRSVLTWQPICWSAVVGGSASRRNSTW